MHYARMPSNAALACLKPKTPQRRLITHFLSTCAGPYAGWRLPFVIVAVPTLLLALLMLLTAEEPPRGVTEAALQVRGQLLCRLPKLLVTVMRGRKVACQRGQSRCCERVLPWLMMARL